MNLKFLSLATALAATAIVNAQICTEMIWNPTSTDTGFEMFEVQGTPGATVSNLYIVSIEGDSGVGQVKGRVAVPTFTFGANGLALIRQGSAAITPAPDAATTIVGPLSWSPDFENGTNTFAVIQSNLPIWALNADIDTNDDGVVDVPIAAGAVVWGAIGVDDGGANDKKYGAALGGLDIDVTFTPACAYRVLNTAGTGTNGWVTSVLASNGANSGPYNFSTQGSVDFSQVTPALTLTELAAMDPGKPNLKWPLTANATISGSLTLGDTIGLSGTENIGWTLSDGTNTYNGTVTVADVATSTYSFNIPSGAPAGAYTLKFKGGTFLAKTLNVTLTGASLSAQNATLKNGDIDQDGEVGPSDFDTVVAQFGGAGDADVDNDGEVGPSDFDIVVANFGVGDE